MNPSLLNITIVASLVTLTTFLYSNRNNKPNTVKWNSGKLIINSMKNKEPSIKSIEGTLPSQLQIKDIIVGNGKKVKLSDTLKLDYVGYLFDDLGTKFDSSWTSGQPSTFILSKLIEGLQQGLIGMKVGGRRVLIIPARLGYGTQVLQSIPANSTLIFVIDLISIQ